MPRESLHPAEAPTVRVDPHGGGGDVRSDGEGGDPQVLRGDGARRAAPMPTPAPTLRARGGQSQAGCRPLGLPGGSTSICRSLKTL